MPLSAEVTINTGFLSYDCRLRDWGSWHTGNGTWVITGPVKYRIEGVAFLEFMEVLRKHAVAAQKFRSESMSGKKSNISEYAKTKKALYDRYGAAIKALVLPRFGSEGPLFNPKYFSRGPESKRFWDFVDLWNSITFSDQGVARGAPPDPRFLPEHLLRLAAKMRCKGKGTKAGSLEIIRDTMLEKLGYPHKGDGLNKKEFDRYESHSDSIYRGLTRYFKRLKI